MKSSAFTLIELLVVVLIIGILSAIALPQYQVAVLKTRLATTMSGVKSLAQAAEAYYLTNGEYAPDDVDALDISSFSGCITSGKGEILCGRMALNYNAGGINWHATVREDRVDGYVCDKNCREGDRTITIKYVQYLAHSPNYPNERFCEASDNSAISHTVCKSLGGELSGVKTYKLP